MEQKVRLRDKDLTSIKQAFLIHFDKNSHLWLFGSRTDLHKRGGDIDLYIETLESDIKVAESKKKSFIFDLYKIIGEQKIDVILNQVPNKNKLPIYEIAKNSGVLLV